ncbi:hypothetical protein APE02nite_19950 [Alkalibacterium pelagium]|nr:hypothetical protein APE02nite_19950 [Alkalibacterium pelagium]
MITLGQLKPEIGWDLCMESYVWTPLVKLLHGIRKETLTVLLGQLAQHVPPDQRGQLDPLDPLDPQGQLDLQCLLEVGQNYHLKSGLTNSTDLCNN